MNKERAKQLTEEVLNRTYPGLQVYVRDISLTDNLVARYKVGAIIREKGFVDASYRVGGMVTSHRFAIHSNYMTAISEFEHGTNWGLHIANSDSNFKILETHTYKVKTIIILLHLPDDESWRLFENAEMSIDKELVETCIVSFEMKCLREPIHELLTSDWLDRCRFSIGMDEDGNLFELKVEHS